MECHSGARRERPDIWRPNQLTVVDRIRKEWGVTLFTEEELHTVCGILEVNCFSIGTQDRSVRGLYPTCFLFSHSCVPNTSHLDLPDFRMTVRVNVPIRKGEPLTLSYTSTIKTKRERKVKQALPEYYPGRAGLRVFGFRIQCHQLSYRDSSLDPSISGSLRELSKDPRLYPERRSGTMERRVHLKLTKFFDCICARCADPTELGTYCSGLRCASCSNGYLVPKEPLDPDSQWLCSSASCSTSMEASQVGQVVLKISRALSEVDKESIESYEGFLKKFSGRLHPSHYFLTEARYALSQMYGKVEGFMIQEMSEELLDRKLEICRQILRVFSVVEPGLSRIRGVTLYELQAALMVQSSLKYQRRAMTQSELRKNMKTVLASLKESAAILDWEVPESQEGQIKAAVLVALAQTENWGQFIGRP